MTLSNKNNKYVRTLCAILFGLFSLLFLYFYQTDVMTLTQHVCSDGQTQYHRIMGTLLITLILFLVQLGVGRFFKHVSLLYALSYIPSLLFLTFLTCIHRTDATYTFGTMVYVMPAALVIFAAALLWMRKISYDTRSMYHYSLPILTLSNTAVMMIAFLCVISLSNNSAQTHIQLKAERFLIEGDADKALEAISESNKSDSSLTMLTAFALSHKGELGEKLFAYKLSGGASALTPNGTSTHFAIYPESKFYDYIGVWTKQKMGAERYLDYLLRHNLGKEPFADYFLCSLLLEKQLDRFAYYITFFYNVKGLLPKHYREALLLYTHLRTNPRIIFHSNIMETDFNDFQDLEKKSKSKEERKTKLRDVYGNTYWFYYFYE